MKQALIAGSRAVPRQPRLSVQAAQDVRCRPFQGLAELAKAGVAKLKGRPDPSKEELLVSWVKRNGGQADVRIDTPASGGSRGVLAQRAFAPDEVIISLPRQLTIPFEGTPEEACILLLHIYHTRREQFGPWLDMLPGPEDFIAWDCLGDTDLAHLQCSQMEGALAQRRILLEAVWQERNGPTQTDALYSRQKLLGSLDLDWDDVQWAANIVRSRNWSMGQTEGGNSMAVMKPLLDMLNHDRASPNEMRFRAGAFELVHRGPGIALGKEITYSYEGAGHELRKDQAAMDYSFMLPAEQDPRLFHIDALASQGVPSGNKMDMSGLSDEGLQMEHEHMSGILDGFPTTMSMDEEVLASTPVSTDEQGTRNAERFLIEVRAARKAALKRHLSDVNGLLERRRSKQPQS